MDSSLFQEKTDRVTMYFSFHVLLGLFAYISLCISVSDFRRDINLDRFFVVSGLALSNELGHFPPWFSGREYVELVFFSSLNVG